MSFKTKYILFMLAMLAVIAVSVSFSESEADERAEEIKAWCVEHRPNQPCGIDDTVW